MMWQKGFPIGWRQEGVHVLDEGWSDCSRLRKVGRGRGQMVVTLRVLTKMLDLTVGAEGGTGGLLVDVIIKG